MTAPFAKYQAAAWPYRFAWEAVVTNMHGGVPRNPDVVRSWLRAKAGWTDDQQIEAEVGRIFKLDPTLTDEDVTKEAAELLADRHVNGFCRDEHGLYLDGRCLKACIKEAASIARATNKLGKRWGETGKGVLSFVAEHIHVVDDRLHFGMGEHDALHTRFVRSRYGTGITVEEVVHEVKLAATVVSDHDFAEHDWAMIWLTAELQGLGSSRSQGCGRFQVTTWERLEK